MSDYQRARTAEQKSERMNEIMDVTMEQFNSVPYQNITLTTIAAALGWSRGNLYKYVTTKEEIFLELYLQEQKYFCDDINHAFHNQTYQFKTFSLKTAEVFTDHPAYIRLHSILPQIIETNVTIDKLTAFKIESFKERETVYEIIARHKPSLSQAEIKQMYMTFLYEAVGLYSHTHASKLLKEAMSNAGMPIKHLDDFQSMLAQFIHMCMEYYVPKMNTSKHSTDS